jgi:hypothetical protein
MNIEITKTIVEWFLILFVPFWTLVVVYMFGTNWRDIPLNKYRGRALGQLCLVLTQVILLGLLWIQVFGYKIPWNIFLIFWGSSMMFFSLWLLGFRVVESRDLHRKFRRLRKKLALLRQRENQLTKKCGKEFTPRGIK